MEYWKSFFREGKEIFPLTDYRYVYCKFHFKGIVTEINGLIAYLQENNVDYTKLEVEGNIQEVIIDDEKLPGILISKFPCLKAIGFCEDWQSCKGYVVYSETGYAIVTFYEYIGMFDDYEQSGEARWTRTYDATDQSVTFYVSHEPHERHPYVFRLEKVWNETYYESDLEQLANSEFADCWNGFEYEYTMEGIPLSEGASATFQIINHQLVRCQEGSGAIEIPKGIQKIDSKAFFVDEWDPDWGFTKIVLPEGVTELGFGAFLGCRGLEEVVLQEGLEIIGGSAFAECYNLSSIVLPNSVKKIGASAFVYANFFDINLPDGILEINSETFYSCSNLGQITLPDSIRKIGGYAFKWCSCLQEVYLPRKLEEIGEAAFEGCESLDYNSITIPDTVICIGSKAFRGCQNEPELIWSKDQKTLLYYSNLQHRNEYIVPSSVEKIAPYVFSGDNGLRKIVISENVTELGDYCFYNCSSLQTVVVKGAVERIGTNIFKGCFNLQKIIVPETMKTLDGMLLPTYEVTAMQLESGETVRVYIAKGRQWGADEEVDD